MEESDLLPLSAIQHFRVCPRQCAFVHLEQLWLDNRYTAEGRVLHEKVDEGGVEHEPGLTIRRSLPVRSFTLGLSGIADLVEFREDGAGRQVPKPVEHKRGHPKPDDCDAVQLCAQAICLEEMLGLAVPAGAFFYWQTRHRHEVEFDAELREATRTAARDLHAMFASGRTPPPAPSPKCPGCSFRDYCKPERLSRPDVARYMARLREGT